jgi:ribose 5-phosphate isomerase A
VKNTQNNPLTKKFAATHAARLIQDGMAVGIGTGSTMSLVIEESGRRMQEEGIKFVAVPTSFQSRILCMKLGIPVREMQDASRLDLAIDGADEVDPNLDLIKGGGAALTREKITAAMSQHFVVVVDESKLVAKLGSSFAIPLEFLPVAQGYVERTIRDLGGEPTLRLGVAKDGPVVTDNGQFIFDVRFAATADLRAIDRALHHTPGVIETGLFFDMAKQVLVGCGSPDNLQLRKLTRES